MDRTLLEGFIRDGLTVREIAAQVGKGYSTVRYWLAKHGLETQHRGPRRAMRGGECRRHGTVEPVVDSHGMRCPKCRSEQVAARRRRVKALLIDEAGGACSLCGYARYQGALQFHHVDPEAKSFQLGMGGLTRSLALMRAEAAKCVLLCANCHAEVEGGITSLL